MKKLLVVLAVALAGLLVWLALGGSRRDGEGVGALGRGGRAPGTDLQTLEPLPPPPRETAEGDARRPSIPEADVAQGSIALLVVRAEDGAAVANAEIDYVDLGELLPEEVAELVPGPWLGTRAVRARTDERGRLELSRPRGIAWIAASFGNLSGFVALPVGTTSARLELRPDVWIDVRVLCHDGAPASNVAIDLLQDGLGIVETGPGEFTATGGGAFVEGAGFPSKRLACAATDRDGIARIRVPAFDRKDSGASGFVWIEADVSAAHPVVAHVDPRAPPTEPIELRLPPLGSVEVHLVRPDGERLREESEVSLLLGSSADGEMGEASQRTSDGTAVFSGVETGLQLDVTAVPLEGIRPGVVSIAGPRSVGERVTVEIEVEGAFAFLTGRLVDAQGVPLASRCFEFLALPGSSGVRRTDALGRFSIGATSETSVLELAPTMREGSRARIELGSLARGARELGDVVLPKAPD